MLQTLSRSLAALTLVVSPALAQSAVTPVPGDIAISEILFNPAAAVDDNDGEYFEVTNISSKALDFAGLYVQDLATVGSATAPFFKIPPGVLPPLFPGQCFVFARSASSAANGAIPVVHYEYSVPTGGAVPADKSKVSHTGMAFGNSAVDGLFITTGSQMSLGGFVIEAVTYDPTQAPFAVNSGIGFERADLMGPWSASNVGASTGTFGSAAQLGTPGAWNSNDATLYPTWTKYVPAFPGPGDTGSLGAVGPCSVTGGFARVRLSGGAPGSVFALVAGKAPFELSLLGGTILVNLSAVEVWATPSLVFDAAGKAQLDIPLHPGLVGTQHYLQWFGYDVVSGQLRFSNGLGVDVAL